MDNDFEPDVSPLYALTVKSNVPTVVGVPEITPVAGLSVKPVGKAPLSMLQVTGIPASSSVRDWLYATSCAPLGRVEVVMTGVGTLEYMLPTRIENSFVATDSPDCTLMVKLNMPTTVGVPEITPVAELSVKPMGKVPPSTLHIACGDVEYDGLKDRAWL